MCGYVCVGVCPYRVEIKSNSLVCHLASTCSAIVCRERVAASLTDAKQFVLGILRRMSQESLDKYAYSACKLNETALQQQLAIQKN